MTLKEKRPKKKQKQKQKENMELINLQFKGFGNDWGKLCLSFGKKG